MSVLLRLYAIAFGVYKKLWLRFADGVVLYGIIERV
jgi:hypothetical protein